MGSEASAGLMARIRGWFAHAFAIEAYDETCLEPEEKLLIDRLAWQINQRGLATPAILFVQSNKHYNFLGSQAAVFAQPFFEMGHVFINGLLRHLGLFIPPKDYPHLISAFEKRYSIEYFTQRLEAQLAGEASLADYTQVPGAGTTAGDETKKDS
jgi:hypothetical protein